MASKYQRDLIGYGSRPVHPHWPNNARVAINFVINYEEGGERCVLHGDTVSEHLLSEIVGTQPITGMRHINMETLYDYGARAGFWRLYDIFTKRKLDVTVFAVGMALERNPEAGKAMVAAGWDIASHGYRWTDYQYIPEAVEREHIRKTIEAQTRICGTRPVGFYQGKPNENTRRLLVEEGGFLYDADSYADDLPYWDCSYGKPHLVVPYSLDCNDMRFAQGLESDAFFRYLRDAFDVLYEEGLTQPKMMSVGLHCRIVGRPGRALGLIKFLDYIATKPHVWVAKRVDIAQHWHRHFHPDLVAQCPAPSPAPKCKL